MTNNESISLLTSGIIDERGLSQQDVNSLEELAQDVHLWPLLLSLIKGQLHHFLKLHLLSYHSAIQNVQAKVHHKGLVAFDKNVPDTKEVDKSRKFAIKVCIEITLELLTKWLSDKVKSLILYTGIGTSLQTAVLNDLWNISEQEARSTVDILWAYGLIQFSNIIINNNEITQYCVEVHAVISDYIMEYIDSNEVWALSPVGKSGILKSISKKLPLTFQKLYGVDNESLLPVTYLKYKLHEIKNGMLPQSLKSFSAYLVTEPHTIISALEMMKYVLMTSSHTKSLLLLVSEDTDLLITKCKQIIRNAYNLCRKFNQTVQRTLHEENYDKLVQTVEEFIENYPMYSVTEKAITMVKKATQYCKGNYKLLCYMKSVYEEFQVATCDYHDIATFTLPHIKFYVDVIKQINSSLQKGLPYIEKIYDDYFTSGKFEKELKILTTKNLTLLQEVVSTDIHKLYL